MKKGVIIFLTLSMAYPVFVNHIFAAEVEAESRIAQVTVYPGSALISRIAALKLNPGEYKVIFTDIIPEIDENSLKASGVGSAEFRLFGAQVKKEFLEEMPAERVKQLQGQIQQLEDEERKWEHNKEMLSEEKQFLDSVRLFSQGQIPKDLVTQMPKVKDLDETLKFLSTKLRENYSQVIDAELNVRDLQKKIDALRNELAQISGPDKKLKRSVVVELEVLKAGSADLIVSYLVKGASWQPIYDARVSFGKSQVELVSCGIVKQTTGEDWKEAELYLSTAKPAISGRMSDILPWLLRPYQPPRWEGREETLKARISTLPSEDIIPSEEGGGRLAEVEYAQVEEKGTAVVYKIPRKTTVKSDGSEHKLAISSDILKANFEYSAYPRISNYAYLRSRVTNSSNLQLLAGRVNIFMEGDFVGLSNIDNIGRGEDFDLYLGIDENVKVKREQIQKKVDETLIAGVPSPTKRINFKYKLVVENYKSGKIRVNLFEAMPVSEDERIRVKISQTSLEPTEKDYQDKKGIWRWELELAPKETKEIFYAFTVEHPRQMQVEGL